MTLVSVIGVIPETMASGHGDSGAGWWTLVWGWFLIMTTILFVGVIVDSVFYKPRGGVNR